MFSPRFFTRMWAVGVVWALTLWKHMGASWGREVCAELDSKNPSHIRNMAQGFAKPRRPKFARTRVRSYFFTAALLVPSSAWACGCFSPPIPNAVEDFAVNQQAEQVIFEAGVGVVTAHVLIQYAGDPAQFAWLLPVPSEPELALSESLLFGLVDQLTSPVITITSTNLCPSPEYVCKYHPPCPKPPGEEVWDINTQEDASGSAGGENPPPVTIIKQEIVGSYDVIVFSAEDAGLTTTWLNDNGFIVNATMQPFMQPYLDAKMLFVAAKLIPGAGTSEIRPLKLTYAAERPMIPLRLTAVAAEPHMPVTAWIFSDKPFGPMDRPLVAVDPDRLTTDVTGRNNYPMVLARTIDEAGGDAFVAEYAGYSMPAWDVAGECCTNNEAFMCDIENNGTCECPTSKHDAQDCDNDSKLGPAIKALKEINQQYKVVTRLTSRMSPEEMTFDPEFAPMTEGLNQLPKGRLNLTGTRYQLDGCKNGIQDTNLFNEIEARRACATVYCGQGECVPVDGGAGCACAKGYVARTFIDLDGKNSVTCIPETAPVDLSIGLNLKNPCDGVDCGTGICVDVGGFPSCLCDGSTVGLLRDDALGADAVPLCTPGIAAPKSPGAENFSKALATVPVCAPAPPSCGSGGWLVPNTKKRISGLVCASSLPPMGAATTPTDPPECGDAPREDVSSGAEIWNTNESDAPQSADIQKEDTSLSLDTNQTNKSDTLKDTVETPSAAGTPKKDNDGCKTTAGRHSVPAIPLWLCAIIGMGTAVSRKMSRNRH
ncbi:MAG: DUF2330 domain-containing protein [Myxococcales bacterium]|nr:DUF2330 domain-containing protein [Myxococcales bacterium]